MNFGVDPKYPFANFVNAMLRYVQSPFMSPQAFANQAKVAYAGDPLRGQRVPGSTLEWNRATQVQQLIVQWYVEGGNVTPDDLDTILAINAGPDAPWNYSYARWADLGWLKL